MNPIIGRAALVIASLFALAIALMTSERAKGEPAPREELLQIIKAEGLEGKIAPNYKILDAFPVKVIVQYATEYRHGERRHELGRDQIRGLADSETEIGYEAESADSTALLVKSPKAMLRLLRSKRVLRVEPDEALTLDMGQVTEVVNMQAVWGMGGHYGEGVTVAIIDTGIRSYENGCQSGTYSPIWTQKLPIADYVVAKISLTPATASWAGGVKYGCYTSDDQHGSVVADVIHGIAPEARLFSIRVAGDASPGTMSGLIQAMDIVAANRVAYSISSVNISMSAATLYAGECSTTLSAQIDSLKANGVDTVVAAGNGSFKTALPEPACAKKAITVGATYDTSGYGYAVLSDSNSGALLDIVAPGCTTSTAAGSKKRYSGAPGMTCGTSLAAPVVTGSVAVLKGRNGQTINKFMDLGALLAATTSKVSRDTDGTNRPLIDLYASATLLPYYTTPSTATTLTIPPAYMYKLQCNTCTRLVPIGSSPPPPCGHSGEPACTM